MGLVFVSIQPVCLLVGAFSLFVFKIIINMYVLLFIYLFFGYVGSFVAARRLSLVVVSRGYSLLWCPGFSLRWLLLWSMGSRCAGFSSCGTRFQ